MSASIEAEIVKQGEPVRIHSSRVGSTCFIFSSPHSGRAYPADFVERADVPLSLLRRSEDAFVDQLFDHVMDQGAAFVEALFPRAFVDPNRAADELDPSMFSDAPSDLSDVLGARTSAGLGVIPRVGADGRPIQSGSMTFEEARARLTQYYKPYHRALREQIGYVLKDFGRAVLIDCHSMPSSSARGADIVLGDRFGSSCSRTIVNAAEAEFRALGFSVVRNRPYAGGYTTEHYGQPQRGVHVLQVEINRGLYLSEQDVRPSSKIKSLKRTLTEWSNRLISAEVFENLAAE